jgi:peroxiredoxin
MKAKRNRTIHICITLSLIFFLNSAIGQEVTLTGNEPDYSGDEITFFSYSDLISQQEMELCSTKVSENGDFKCSFSIDQTRKIFTELGVYRAYLFVEPGKTYNIALPPKQEKSRAQKLNPYFTNYPHHIGIKNEEAGNLNKHIYQFFKQYNHFCNKNARNLDNTRRKTDSILTSLDQFTDFSDPFYHILKKYKTEGLKLKLYGNLPQLKKRLFNDTSIYYHNPSYRELFNTTFEDYFKDFASSHGFVVHDIIETSRNIRKIDSVLRKDSLLRKNPKLRELVILKGLHDLFYADKLPNKAVIATIDSFANWTNNNYHKKIAGNIKEKTTQLLHGYQAPEFCLYNRDSSKTCLKDFKGEYVYLGFCNKLNYTCLKNYKILKNLHKKHKKHFRIVIISTTDSFEKMKQFANKKEYHWTFLHWGNNKSVLKDYNIKTMPTYFFIGPDGKLILSPAPKPNEDIEQRTYKILKKNGVLQKNRDEKPQFDL